MLFSFFDLFLRVESPHDRLYYDFGDTLYITRTASIGVKNEIKDNGIEMMG